MSNEMFYIDESGKKQDAALHADILREDDHDFQVQIAESNLQAAVDSGDEAGIKFYRDILAQEVERRARAQSNA